MALSTEQLQTLHDEIFGGSSPLAATYATIEAQGGDPVARDQLLAEAINSSETNRTVIRASMSGKELFEATDAADFAGLTDAKKQLWVTMGGWPEADPRVGGPTEQLVKWIFGAGADTVAALGAVRLQTVSRAAELGLPEVKAADVGEARALP